MTINHVWFPTSVTPAPGLTAWWRLDDDTLLADPVVFVLVEHEYPIKPGGTAWCRTPGSQWTDARAQAASVDPLTGDVEPLSDSSNFVGVWSSNVTEDDVRKLTAVDTVESARATTSRVIGCYPDGTPYEHHFMADSPNPA